MFATLLPRPHREQTRLCFRLSVEELDSEKPRALARNLDVVVVLQDRREYVPIGFGRDILSLTIPHDDNHIKVSPVLRWLVVLFKSNAQKKRRVIDPPYTDPYAY